MPCAPARCSSSGSASRSGARCRSPLRVLDVRAEGPGVTTVTVGGPGVARMPVRAGQFFQWRFLDGPGWTRANPYSISAAPDGRTLRFTAAHAGDGSARLATLRPGTRVLVEGPYGRLHGGVRAHRKVLLMGSGIGITPLRALLEELDQAPGDVTVVHRVHDRRDAVLVGEIDALAAARGARYLAHRGPAAARPSQLAPATRPATSPTRRRCCRSCPTSPTTTCTSAARTAGCPPPGTPPSRPACRDGRRAPRALRLLTRPTRPTQRQGTPHATHHDLAAQHDLGPGAPLQLPHVHELGGEHERRRPGRHRDDVVGRVHRLRVGSSSGSGSSSDSGSSSGSGSGSSSGKTYTGDAVSTRYGDVQVKITVANGKVTAAEVTPVPWNNPRDQQINSYAVPILNSEAVDAAERPDRHGLGCDVHLARATSSPCSRPSTRRTCDHRRDPRRPGRPAPAPARPPRVGRAGHGDAGERARARRRADPARPRGGRGPGVRAPAPGRRGAQHLARRQRPPAAAAR